MDEATVSVLRDDEEAGWLQVCTKAAVATGDHEPLVSGLDSFCDFFFLILLVDATWEARRSLMASVAQANLACTSYATALRLSCRSLS